MTQFHTCNQHLSPDALLLQKKRQFSTIRPTCFSARQGQKSPGKKGNNRASESWVRTFLSDTLPKKSKETLCTETSHSAGGDALAVQHETSETS